MKNFTKLIPLFLIYVFSSLSVNAQVGVGTITPKAALDVTSSTTGFLMPRIALTDINVSAPVVNPAGGALDVGTMIFNTATAAGTTNPGVSGVVPGLYFWDGSKWVPQFQRGFEKRYVQSADLTVAKSASTYTNIPGLSSLSFVAPYDGTYQFTFTGYLGSETPVGTVSFTNNDFGWVEGNFRMTINGVDYKKYSYSVSFYNHASSMQYYQLFNESNVVVKIPLTAGSTCTLNASYNGAATDGYSNNTTALSHVVGRAAAILGNECEINVIYIGK